MSHQDLPPDKKTDLNFTLIGEAFRLMLGLVVVTRLCLPMFGGRLVHLGYGHRLGRRIALGVS
jgi:hypothetical protein